jgi:CheY-like chemotaxis protein
VFSREIISPVSREFMEKIEILENGQEKKVLIVDDDPVTLALLEKIFLSDGYWVAKATNGKDALYIADEFTPDVIILDIMMPVMDGTETIEFLEKNPRTKNIPILFLTSLISKEEESSKFGSNRCFLAKPIEKNKLLKEVERWIEGPSIK